MFNADIFSKLGKYFFGAHKAQQSHRHFGFHHLTVGPNVSNGGTSSQSILKHNDSFRLMHVSFVYSVEQRNWPLNKNY